MSKELTLSIVIPAYNEEHHLKACLDSIANQTEKPDEVIVVDNNSTDETAKIAKSYKFVKLVKESIQGIVFARNKGFNAYDCEIIGRIDADTILPQDWVQRVKFFYQNPKNQDRILTGGGYFYNLRLPRFNGWVLSQLAYRMNRVIMGHYIVWGSNMAIPKKLWDSVKKDLCLRTDIHEDLDLAIHLHKAGYIIEYHENLKVGVYLKRMYEDRENYPQHLARWPRTLRTHNLKRWIWGSLGNFLIRFILQPFFFLAEGIGQLMGRHHLR